MKNKITLYIDGDTEMAQIKIGKKILFLGNFWDFHPGTHGADFEINGKTISFKKEWTEDIDTPKAVAEMIAAKIGAELEIKKESLEF
jgi:hypothetical protein